MSSSVARREAPSVPALAPTPATTITAEDIAVPKLYIGQYTSRAVKEQLAKLGDVFLALSADDDEPNILWRLGQDASQGVLFHVLHLRKGKSFTEGPGAPLDIWDFDDPEAHPKAWTTYKYTLFLPDIDPDMPATILLTKTGKPAAQKINTVVARNAAAGPSWNLAFRLTSAKREGPKGDYGVAQVAMATADPKHVQQATALYELIRPGLEAQSQSASRGDEPSI